jgi:hypothetical protein
VESRVFSLFPPRLRTFYPGGSLRLHFLSHVQKYCSAKFTSYEIDAEIFLETVVPTCMKINTNRTSKSRGVILSTFREPIQRTLSHIHQICNNKLDQRDPATIGLHA